MTEFFLIRHAINDWVSTGRLAGWTPGVHLNADGRSQAEALGKALADIRIHAVFASPLERTVETAEAIAKHHPNLMVQKLEDVGEVRYGAWQGEKLSTLRRQKMWTTVQNYPSRMQFPDGESIREAQSRAVTAIEDLARLYPQKRVAVISHSDIIKLMVTHFLGAHIDMFQRIEIAPASLTIIRLGSDRPYIIRVNDTSFLPTLVQPTSSPNQLRRLMARLKRK